MANSLASPRRRHPSRPQDDQAKQVEDNLERWIKFTVRKTRRTNATETEKPILDVLWNIIQASPCGTETFIETDRGKPYTDAGFGNAMR